MASFFCHQHRVSYAECTVGNHVYHARYLDFLEAARGEWLRSLGAPVLHWQALTESISKKREAEVMRSRFMIVIPR